MAFYSVWMVWTRRTLDVWRLGITRRFDEWEGQLVLMWKYWSWETIATNTDIFPVMIDDIFLDQTIVPERTHPYRHNGRFKIQKNVQPKASNQPGAQPMGSTPTPPKRPGRPGGGGLTQHFPKAKATAALSENQGPKVFDEFRRAAEKQAFLGRHPPKGYGGQR